jgi:hypothetical protein
MSRYEPNYEYHEYDPYRGRSRSMPGTLLETGLTLLGGLAIGAGLMYLLDPDEGPHRRKYIRRGTSGLLHAVGDTLGSAYDSVTESVSDRASALRDRASDMTSSAGKYLRRSRDTAQDYVEEYTDRDEDHMGTGMILSMVLGGSALAAVLYMLATEYDSIRRGDLSGAASHAYQRVSDKVSAGTQYVRDTANQYMGSGSDQNQQGQQTAGQSMQS